MSDIDTGYDGGHEGGDADYGHYEAGQEHDALDQLHQDAGSEHDYHNQFQVYDNDHAAAEDTHFNQGHAVEYDNPSGAHYAEQDYTNYDHNAAEQDHVFAAEGSEDSHQAEYSDLDALRHQFDAAFASGTEYHGDGGAAEISAVSH